MRKRFLFTRICKAILYSIHTGTIKCAEFVSHAEHRAGTLL
ncbi:MAG: hypothetical protein PHC72_05505 [Eubacteriales bacterium]|nr:hypothetical protein [Eubacteriales bacterium]